MLFADRFSELKEMSASSLTGRQALGELLVTEILSCVQMGATTPNIVAPTMLGVSASVLAVVCKRMQQFPTSLGPAVHHEKNTTHKSL